MACQRCDSDGHSTWRLLSRSVLVCLGSIAALSIPPVHAQDFDLAAPLAQLETLTRGDSNNAELHFELALAYWNARRWMEVEEHLRTAVTIDPRYAEAYMGLAALPYAKRPQLWNEQAEDDVPEEWQTALEESDRLYRRAVMIDPLVNLRTVGVTMDEALERLREIARLVERLATYRTPLENYIYGLENLYRGLYPQAYQNFSRLIDGLETRRDREDTPQSVLWSYAIAAAQVQRYEEAVWAVSTLLDMALAEEGKDSLIHIPLLTNDYRYLLGVFNQNAGLHDRAIPLYQEALTEDLGLYMAHVRMADAYQELEQWDEAIAERRRAVEVNPDDPSLVFDLGLTLGLADNGECEEVLADALTANPRNARAAYFLALVKQVRGKRSEARGAFEHFLAIAPSSMGTEIADARARLASLPPP